MRQTYKQVEMIRTELSSRGLDLPFVPAMRYSNPSISHGLAQLKESGADRVLALPQYPQYSTVTTGSCLAVLKKEARALGLKLSLISAYPEAEGLAAAWKETILEKLNSPEVAAEEARKTHILFLAHSIPLRYVNRGDPYPRHVNATASAIMALMEEEFSWSVGYQSRLSKGRWLSPGSEEAVRNCPPGVKRILVVPISFMTENLETIYDLDSLLARFVDENTELDFLRARVPALSPKLIGSLADIVQNKLEEKRRTGQW